MKASLLLAALILLAAALLGWRGGGRLAAAKETHARLVREAESLGISSAAAEGKGGFSRDMKTRRGGAEDKAAQAKAFAARLAAFAREMKELERKGESPDAEVQKRIFALLDEMLKLDSSQLEMLVGELRAAPDLDDDMRRGVVGLAIMMLANDHPREALALFTESSDLLGKEGAGQHVVASALSKWARDEPMAALEWIRENQEKHPDLVNEDTKRSVVEGAARVDPRLAFQLVGEIGLKEIRNAADRIAGTAETPAARTAVIGAMRDHLKGVTDPEARRQFLQGTMGKLGGMAMNGGFEASAEWVDKASLGEEERAAFADGLSSWDAAEDTGKWILWMEGKVPEDQYKRKTEELVRGWARSDYKAAGEWIGTREDGPARRIAVRGYALAVAPYEPASAAQWAETLPQGKDRDETLQTIHSEWKKKDGTAAAEFARKHGLAP